MAEQVTTPVFAAFVKGRDGDEPLAIIGTYEQVFGTAIVSGFERVEDCFQPIYGGETRVDWDGQESVEQAGERMFVADDGHCYPESEVVFRRVDATGAAIGDGTDVKVPPNPDRQRRALEEHLRAAIAISKTAPDLAGVTENLRDALCNIIPS